MTVNSVRVLVIDDDASIRALLAVLCRREGWSVETVADGEAGLDRIASFRPDVIVLDLMMPVVSGFDLMEKLDRNSLHQVIVLTAASHTVLRALPPEKQIWKLIRKPFDLPELLAEIRLCAEAHHQLPPTHDVRLVQPPAH